MTRAPFLALLVLAACKPADRAEPAPVASPAGSAAANAVIANSVGVGSRLSANVSALNGAVTGFSVRRTNLGTVVALDADVLFDFDKAVLRPDATPALQRAAATIRRGGTGSIAVFGYTDAKGDDDYNLELSRQRAQAVTDWLLKQPGVATHAFEVRGKGEADPVAPNAKPDGSDDPAGRARNRRVEIVVPDA